MNRWLIASLGLTLLVASVAGYLVGPGRESLPERAPIHWGIDGQPDGFATREQLVWHLLLLPACMVGMIALTLLLPALSPRPFSLDRFRPTYDYIMFLVVTLFGCIAMLLFVAVLRPGFDLPRWLMVGILTLFALMGEAFGGLRPNLWVGIRTPWTIADETVWLRTHRLAGRMWLGLCGTATLVIAAGGHPFWVGFPAVLVAALVPVVYSRLLYKHLERRGQLHPVTGEETEAS